MSFNWAQIESGAVFHALVNILLLHEDPSTRPFTKPGADGAIDALLVGRTVHQAKYHKNARASNAFADARAEAEKIADYTAPGSKWAPLWKGVDAWRLVTNAPFGPDDDKRWREEIAPLFKKLGLRAEYWVESHLEERLAARPDVAQAFFGGKVRFFVTLAEHHELLRQDAVLERAYDLPLEGREEAVDRIRAFVQDKDSRLLLIHAPGGVGKSRLQAEAARTVWQEGLVDTVYCGSPHLPTTADWYVGTIPEAPALVLLDEPGDPAFIDRFLHELKTRVKHWKVIVTARTPRDPIVSKLTDRLQRILAEPLELDTLKNDAAFRLAEGLVEPLDFSEEQKRHLVRWMVEVCGRPVWMTMAVRVIEEHRELLDLPTDRLGVARRYVDEIVRHTRDTLAKPDQVRMLLYWLALYQPVSRQNEDELAFLAKTIGLDGPAALDALFVDLERRRVVTLYGVDNRMAEIRPDVLREHLLIDWLTYEGAGGTRQPSQAARDLAADLVRATEGNVELPRPTQLITMLGRMEFRLEGLRLLDPVADALVDLAGNATTTLEQRRALELAEALAFFRPGHIVEIARSIRMRDVEEAAIEIPYYGPKPIAREEQVFALPRLLANAAPGATTGAERKTILGELLTHVELENNTEAARPWPNDGKRAATLIPRLVHARHGYRSSFQGEATALADEHLTALAKSEPVSFSACRALLGALVALERTDDRPGDSALTLVIERSNLLPEGEPGQIAISIRERLWKLAEDPMSPKPTCALVWSLLADLHRDLNQLRGNARWKVLLTDDLERCVAVAKRSRVDLGTLQSARGLCDWHIQFEKDDPRLRHLADAFDAAYRAHPAVAPYVELFGSERVHDDAAHEAAADELAEKGDIKALEAFLAGAQQYTKSHSESPRSDKVSRFAWVLGHRHGEHASVLEFALEHVRKGPSSSFFQVALAIGNGLLHAQRSASRGDAVAKTLEDLAAAAGEAGAVSDLLLTAYAQAGVRMVKVFTEEDVDFVLRHENELAELSVYHLFLVLGRFSPLDPGRVLSRAPGHFACGERDEKAIAVGALWRGFVDRLPIDRDQWDPPMSVVDALLDLTALVPDLPEIRRHVGWEIREVCNRVEKKPISWLLERVHRRRAAFAEHNRQCREEERMGLVWLIPEEDSVLLEVVETIPDESPAHEVVKAMRALLGFDNDGLASSNHLPELLMRLDRHGRVLPDLIAERLADPLESAGVDQVAENAEYAGAYAMGSPPWRIIALAACRRLDALSLGEEDRVRVYSRLTPRRGEAYSAAIDKIHPRWRAAVDDAKKKLEAAPEPELRAFWQWRLERAETELKHAKGLLEEELRSLGAK